MKIKESIIDFYYQKKILKRRARLQKLDNELFNEYYNIYERIRMSQYGTNRLFPNERYCVATDAFYEFSDKLVERFAKKQKTNNSANSSFKNGIVFAASAVALTSAQIAGAVPISFAAIAAAIALAGGAVVQNIENRYAKKHHLTTPSKTDFVYDKILTPDFKFVKDRYEDMAAIRFRKENPESLGYSGVLELSKK